MRRFVDNYQDYMTSSNSTSKHVGVLSVLSELVSSRKLLDLSAVEQDIACSENMSKQYDVGFFFINFFLGFYVSYKEKPVS